MPRHFPLQPLLDLAQDHTDAAAQKLHKLKTKWHEEEEKQRQLCAFREDYRARLEQSTQQGLSISTLKEYRLFLEKLELAISQQEKHIAQCKLDWENGQKEWLIQRQKLKAYGILSQRHDRAQAQRDARLDQREQDEYARKSFQNKPSENE